MYLTRNRTVYLASTRFRLLSCMSRRNTCLQIQVTCSLPPRAKVDRLHSALGTRAPRSPSPGDYRVATELAREAAQASCFEGVSLSVPYAITLRRDPSLSVGGQNRRVEIVAAPPNRSPLHSRCSERTVRSVESRFI